MSATPKLDEFFKMLDGLHGDYPVFCAEVETFAGKLERSEANLLAALKECESYLVQRGVETRGTVGRTVILPKIRAAIAKAEGDVPL